MAALSRRSPRTCVASLLRAGNCMALQFLIGRGINVDAIDFDGHSVLLVAARLAGRDAVRVLLQSGARVDLHSAKDQRITPLIAAAQSASVAVVAELLAAGADVNRASNHDTPLMAACSVDAVDVVDALLAAGADANVAVAGRTPLHCAVVAQAHRSLRRLLNSTQLINFNDVASMNSMILATAVMARDKEAVAMLVAAGANLAAADRDGLTPLLLACYLDCSPDMVALLLVAGSDHTARERHHRTPLDVARSRQLRRLLTIYVSGADQIDWLPQDTFEEVALLSHATTRLDRERFVLRRSRALAICLAMQPLQLPALLTVMVIDEALQWHAVTMHTKWRIATLIKHFHDA